MLNFRGYECGREIGWGDLSTIYIAGGAAAANRANLVIKVIQLTGDRSADLPDAKSESGFLRAASEQQAAAAAGCEALAPVHDFGAEDLRGYFVTNRYARSAESLIRGKVHVQAPGFQHLIGSVLRGLNDLKTRSQRGHGNLKPSNILLDGSGQIRTSPVFLSDLAPTADSSTYAADLAALGLIFYELLRQREIGRYDWPLRDEEVWKQTFHKDAARWLAFCNSLLDPALKSKAEPIDEALAHYRTLTGRPASSRPVGGHGIPSGSGWLKWTASGVLAVALICGIVFFFHQRSERQLEESWKELNLAYQSWFGGIESELEKNRSFWSSDDYLREHLIGPTDRFQTIAQRGALHLGSASDMPPEIRSDKTARVEVREARRQVNEVQKLLPKWRAKDEVNKAYAEFSERHLTGALQAIATCRGDFVFDQTLVTQITQTESVQRLASETAGPVRRLLDEAQTLEPQLPGLSRAVADQLASADLSELRRRIEDVGGWQGLGRVKTYLKQTGDAIVVARIPPGHTFAEQPGNNLSDKLEAWKLEAENYRRLSPSSDPKSHWNSRLGKIRDSATRVSLEKQIAELPNPLIEADRPQLAKIESELALAEGSTPAEIVPSVAAPTAPAATQAPLVPDDRKKAYNIAFAQFQREAAAAPDVTGLAAARERFLVNISNLPVTSTPTVQDFRARLQGFPLANAPAKPQAPPLLGKPPVEAGNVVSYQLSGRTRLDFVLVQPPGAEAFFLGRTEVPVKLADDLVRQYRAGLQFPNASAAGPASWQPIAGGILPRAAWNWNTMPVPSPERPNESMPLNFVSPALAPNIARALGCRLPTVREWQAAFALPKLQNDAKNLRDASWLKYWTAVNTYNNSGFQGRHPNDVAWPVKGSFFLRLGQNEADQKAAAGTDDGTIWFWPTEKSEPGKFADLVGNVAEYVLDDADKTLRVIGASALAPPGIAPNEPLPIPPGLNAQTIGWSDVGLRLALTPVAGTAPSVAEMDEFKRVVRDAAPLP